MKHLTIKARNYRIQEACVIELDDGPMLVDAANRALSLMVEIGDQIDTQAGESGRNSQKGVEVLEPGDLSDWVMDEATMLAGVVANVPRGEG